MNNSEFIETLKRRDGDLARESQSLQEQIHVHLRERIHPLVLRFNQVNQARAGINSILVAEGVLPQVPMAALPQISIPPQFNGMMIPIGGMPAFSVTAGIHAVQVPPLVALITGALADGVPRTSAEIATIVEKQGYQFQGKSGARVVHTTMMGLRPKGHFIKDNDKWRIATPAMPQSLGGS